MEATQIVSHVVPFPQSVPATKVTQQELVDLIEARSLADAMAKQVKALEDDIKARLQSGAPVEQGVHVAELKESSFRRNVAWKDVVVRLATRLKLDGRRIATACWRPLSQVRPSLSTFTKSRNAPTVCSRAWPGRPPQSCLASRR